LTKNNKLYEFLYIIVVIYPSICPAVRFTSQNLDGAKKLGGSRAD